MSTIGATKQPDPQLQMPDIYPRLAYEDERAALDYLVRVFQFEEIREVRALSSKTTSSPGCVWATAS